MPPDQQDMVFVMQETEAEHGIVKGMRLHNCERDLQLTINELRCQELARRLHFRVHHHHL